MLVGLGAGTFVILSILTQDIFEAAKITAIAIGGYLGFTHGFNWRKKKEKT